VADNTDSLLVFSQAVRDRIQDNLLALDIMDVYFGDQGKIPRVPAACVEPVDKTRVLDGAPRRTLNEIQVYILIYHALVDDVQVTLEQSIQRAEAVETLLHSDPQFGGLVIHCLVQSIESGYAERGKGSLYRTSRLTFVGTTKTNLPLSF